MCDNRTLLCNIESELKVYLLLLFFPFDDVYRK